MMTLNDAIQVLLDEQECMGKPECKWTCEWCALTHPKEEVREAHKLALGALIMIQGEKK